MRNGLRLHINHEFVKIATARLPVERVTPLPKNLFQLFLKKLGELLHDINAQPPQCSLRYFANPGNLSYRERREETRFASQRNPYEAAQLGLIGSHLRREPRRGQPARAGKRRLPHDNSKQLISGPKRRPVKT